VVASRIPCREETASGRDHRLDAIDPRGGDLADARSAPCCPGLVAIGFRISASSRRRRRAAKAEDPRTRPHGTGVAL
jgi:hypothetical protein